MQLMILSAPVAWKRVFLTHLVLMTALVALACWPLARASAQACEDDGGTMCLDDAGADDEDSGMMSTKADAAAPGVACSCTSDEYSGGQGRIHLCTGSTDKDICGTLECDRGTFR